MATYNPAAFRFDKTLLLMLPALLFILVLFVYPFLYGFLLSFTPQEGGALANYRRFFSDPYLYVTLGNTFRLAVPVSLFTLLLALPLALRVRHMRNDRLLTAVFLLPITLGTVFVAEGVTNYFGAQGWFNRALIATGIVNDPVRLLHNYTGVFIGIFISLFPFAFLLTLAFASGIDPSLERAGASLGAQAGQRFRYIILPLLLPGLAITLCLTFVQAFSVLPTAVLLGAPSGSTRVISIPAYEAATEYYDYSMASAIAVIMAITQFLIVAVILGLRHMTYRGSSGNKG